MAKSKGSSMLVITDEKFTKHKIWYNPDFRKNAGKGLIKRDYGIHPVGCRAADGVYAGNSSTVDNLPRESWPDLIADRTRDQSWAMDVWEDSGKPVEDQDGLGYCHAFSPAGTVKIERHRNGLPKIEISPSSVAAPVTGYSNRGAYIFDDLAQMRNVGFATTEFVKYLTTRKADFKPGWEKNAELHKAEEWTDLDPRKMLDQWVSMLLAGFSICTGHNWWGHAVTHMKLALKQPIPQSRMADFISSPLKYVQTYFLNSWGVRYGTNGVGILEGTRQMPNQASVCRAITLSPQRHKTLFKASRLLEVAV